MTNPRSKSEGGLSKTCINYIYEWIKELPEFYGRSINFRSKYFDKGNACEQDSIDLASRVFDWGMVSKNEEFRSNEYIMGTCDIVLAKKIVDIKNSWSQKTFPLFDTQIPIDGYGYQGTGYCDLWQKPEFELIYTLMDAPESLIEKEARSRAWSYGLEEVPADLFEEVKEEMTYSNFDDELRIKKFGLTYDPKVTEAIYQRVEDCRKFISGINKVVI